MWSGTLASLAQLKHPELRIAAKDFSPYLRAGFPWHSPKIEHGKKSADLWWADLRPIFENAFEAVGFANNEAVNLASEVKEAYTDSKYWSVFDDVVPCLSDLSSQGWKHFIISNHVPELPDLVEALGLSTYFEAVFTSAKIGYEKPNPKIFEYALAMVGKTSQVWVIGDSYSADIIGAEAVGIPAILVRKSCSDARYNCKSLDEISTILSAN